MAPVLLALLAGAAHGAVEGYHYTREVQVPAAGWVRVPLDLAAIQHLAPGGADLHVVSPAGGEVPVHIETAAPRTERRPVKPATAERDETGWSLLLDLGPDTIPHERLFLQTVRPSLARPDRIESSADGNRWLPLAPGETFRAQAGEDWTAISYPATGDRWLRLHWPREAGAPKIAAAEVESVTGPTLSVATGNADCDPGPPGAIFCTLPLPAAGQVVRRLTVEVEGKGNVGYRLDAPREGRWRSLAEGVWQREGRRTRHVLTGGAEALPDDHLRLELYAAGAAPRLASYGLELPVQTALFKAEEAGRYTLAYGGAPRRAGTAPAVDEDADWLEAGAESEHPLPALPATAAAPGVRLGSLRLKASWRVTAPAARAGSLVRLELPEAVYAFARTDLGNLRLVAADRQIPFYLWSPATPDLALWESGVRPSEDVRAKEGTLEIHLARPGLPLTELDVLAPARPLHRSLTVRYLEPVAQLAQRGAEAPKPVPLPNLRETWECMPQPPLPCRLRIPLPGRAPSVLALQLRDGDNPPLADLDTAVWRRRHVLLFVWPGGTSVRLLAGPDSLKAPSYDLQAVGDALLGRPWQPAEIGSGGNAAAGGQPWWSRWLRPMMLGVAALCLVFLLRRILMET
ncbi:MAG TPA: DUF3999 family protein [Thermoanaerobaculia bacterium]|nr:DUF3999 family protein [Thermoanaerobaculia bacterium]